MAELRFSSRRRNNHVSSGRRIYANPTDVLPEMQAHERVAKPAPWEAHTRRDNRKQAGIGNGPQEQAQQDEQDVSGKDASGKGHVSQNQEEDIKRAAALLLASAGDILLADLCESCCSVLHHRLTSIASGECLAALSLDSLTSLEAKLPASGDRSSGGPNEGLFPISGSHVPTFVGVSLSENGVDDHHAEERAVAESPSSKIVAENANRYEVAMKKEDGLRQAPRQEPTAEKKKGSAAARSNDSTANHIIKSALQTIRNAPAYRTRSISRQAEAGLLQTPHQNSESASDNRESGRISEVGRKKDFCLFERVNGQIVNILQGLELHTNVFDSVEQKELIDFIFELQELGRNQKLRKRTYSEPRKWMRGKGRVTIQFGCCYNYAVDKDGNPPGIIREEEVDDIPAKLCMVIKRLVQWQVLPSTCIPDSCIVNIYDVGDCIPPHIDHHDFVRPFCTLSLLSECDIVFGTNLKIVGPGEFKGSISIPLPTGSVLILNGNGADVAKHAVPAVPAQRISITFRKMDPTKVPHTFRPDKELLSTQPLMNETNSKSRTPVSVLNSIDGPQVKSTTTEVSQFSLDNDFPALGRPVLEGRHRNLRS